MSFLFGVLLTFVLLLGVARLDLTLRQWFIITAAGLTALGLLGQLSGTATTILWGTWLVAVILTQIPALRRLWISRPILSRVRNSLPPMSDTERTAIEAGTVWWEAELFRGNPDFNKLLQIPQPHLTAKEQAFLDGPVETLCRMVDDWEITHELNQLPEPVWDYIKRERFLGMIIPESYGGLGFSATAHSQVVLKIASRSISTAVSVMVPNSLGPAELLLHYGSEKQKNHYLPRLAEGLEIPCFALTGPSAGSDAGAIPDYGVVCKSQWQGKEVLGLRLNWEKRYITLGPIATLLGLAFKVYDPDQLLGKQKELGITCALIPCNTPGVEIGDRHYPLNAAFQNGPNSGKDVFIPMDWVIGGEEKIGQGWRMLMESLSAGRGISLPALSVAGAKHVVRSTGAYARVRKQFHLPIGKFEAVEEVLARMGGMAYMMDATRLLTTSGLDANEKPSVVTAIAKYNLTEMMRIVINDGMDVHGGRGICMGPSNYLASSYQSIPISITVEGANILTRSLIVFGQGAMRCHPYLLQELEAAYESDEKKGLRRFDNALFQHMGYAFRNAARALVYGVSAKLAFNTPDNIDPETRQYYRQLSRFSSAFSIAADVALLVLGGALKRKEKLSGRFADALSFLYFGSAVLKHYEDQGRNKADLPLLKWSMDYSLYKVQTALDEIIELFPSRPLGWLLRLLIFPLGRSLRRPNGDAARSIAAILMQPGEVRKRLIAGIFHTTDPDDITGRVEYALIKTIEAEPVEKRLYQAGLSLTPGETNEQWVARLISGQHITEAEANLLSEAHNAVRHAIMVDAFAPKSHAATAKTHIAA